MLINDLKRHHAPLAPALAAVLARVADSGWYVLGAEVEAFEREFATWCGTEDCVGVANGTDALELALRALDLPVGSAVATVANAGLYSTVAILAAGLMPRYVDVDPNTLQMDPQALAGVVADGVAAVVATHLFGTLADVGAIGALCRARGVPLIEDCAQAHGAEADGRRAGAFGDLGCFSFYPTKNLGALGDGGAVVCRPALGTRLRELRQYGWSRKYWASRPGGRNSRLDEVQAAVLRVKLPHVDRWNARRRAIATRYDVHLDRLLVRPVGEQRDHSTVAHLYVVRTPQRDALAEHLGAAGVATDVHYPVPDHRQPATAALPVAHLPVTEAACAEVLTLPCFPELGDDEVDAVIRLVNGWRR